MHHHHRFFLLRNKMEQKLLCPTLTTGYRAPHKLCVVTRDMRQLHVEPLSLPAVVSGALVWSVHELWQRRVADDESIKLAFRTEAPGLIQQRDAGQIRRFPNHLCICIVGFDLVALQAHQYSSWESAAKTHNMHYAAHFFRRPARSCRSLLIFDQATLGNYFQSKNVGDRRL